MRIDVMDSIKTKKDAKKYILNKLPLASKIAPFNTVIGNIKLEYIEYKILKYEIKIKKKSKKLFKREINKDTITILVNTYNGKSESIDNLPKTSIKYVTKTCIKNTNIKEEDLILAVKEQILFFLNDNMNRSVNDKGSISDITLVDIKSIYKPCWIAKFKGRDVVIDM